MKDINKPLLAKACFLVLVIISGFYYSSVYSSKDNISFTKAQTKERPPLGLEAIYEDEIININTADQEKLKSLPGIGDVTSNKIIEYRLLNGSFKSIEDIKNVDGIGDKTFEKIKDLITVDEKEDK